MKSSEMFLPTLKEIPAEAQAISHILMIRAGMIRKLTSGVYSYLPLGFRVLKKIETIISEEMNKEGAQQVLLPAIQPAELWTRSGRFEVLGQDMITFVDRHKKINVLGPTHEEVITTLVKNEVNSYRQLPLIIYQIQTKFRDEARPRFGVVRSREFIMKDAYSFDCDIEGLNKSYKKMYDAYFRIFERCGLRFIAVEADTGIMGGDVSHEFMVLADSGEDKIVRCKKCGYAASIDKAECIRSDQGSKTKDQKPLKKVLTPDVSSVKDVADFLKVSSKQLVKTLIYISDHKPIAVLIRGDHEVNEAKLKNVLKIEQLIMANEEVIQKITNGALGFSGPVGLEGIYILADYSVKNMVNFVVGANTTDAHLINVNLDRDFKVGEWADVRTVTAGDLCPRCRMDIEISHAIEVGHVFKLGTKYSETLQAYFLDEHGNAQKIIMGCYGIGVTRIIAACIEQNHDEHGIIWPEELSPFQVIILPLNPEDKLSKTTAEEIYGQLSQMNVEVLLDDRNVRAGIKFKDADLTGIPIQIIIGEKSLKHNLIEIKLRINAERYKVERSEIISRTMQLVQKARK